MRLKISCISLLSFAMLAASANAAIILDLVIDPATDADSGIAPIGPHVVTSSQSGADRWHLYAFDNTPGSFGISSYDITVNNATTSLHRSPITNWNDADENGPFATGFSLLRNANNSGPGIFQASQPLPGTTPVLITGFGQQASNFTAKIPQATSFALETSGQWGNYATDSSLADGWVLIGEGAYANGTPPTVGPATVVTYFDANFLSLVGDVCVIGPGEDCGLGVGGGDPPIVVDATLPGPRHATFDSPVTHQFTTSQGDPVINWSDVQLDSYTNGFGAQPGAPGALFDPTLSGTGLFNWDTQGSSRGTYVFSVLATNDFSPSDRGTLTVEVTEVPEPATLALLGLAMVGLVGAIRRR